MCDNCWRFCALYFPMYKRSVSTKAACLYRLISPDISWDNVLSLRIPYKYEFVFFNKNIWMFQTTPLKSPWNSTSIHNESDRLSFEKKIMFYFFISKPIYLIHLTWRDFCFKYLREKVRQTVITSSWRNLLFWFKFHILIDVTDIQKKFKSYAEMQIN